MLIKRPGGLWAIFVSAFLFIVLSVSLSGRVINWLDSSVYGFISQFISEGMTLLVKGITLLGSSLFLWVVTVVLLVFFRKNKKIRFMAWSLAASLAGSTLLNEGLKLLFRRFRPDILILYQAGGYSFPSGHSMAAMSFYGLLAYLIYKYGAQRYKRVSCLALCLLIGTVGFSRIYLGVHFASDVIAGYLAGICWLAFFITFILEKIYFLEYNTRIS